jgi:uridine kinase
MRDDILIITEDHRKAAKGLFDLLLFRIESHRGKFILTIAGESGAGKSEVAASLAMLLEEKGIPVYIIQQDDYFQFPPRTNARMREDDIRWVGPGEVRIDLINRNIESVIKGDDPVEKPLVIFSEDSITTEQVHFSPYKVIILEGTYTSLVQGIDCRVFIDRDLDDTREDRLKRNRERQDEYLDKILQIEHAIISRHKDLADIIITKDFNSVPKA